MESGRIFTDFRIIISPKFVKFPTPTRKLNFMAKMLLLLLLFIKCKNIFFRLILLTLVTNSKNLKIFLFDFYIFFIKNIKF